MTWPDFVTVGLCLVMAILESKRGFVPAFFAMIGAILTVEIAASVYQKLVSPSISYASANVIAVLIGFGLVTVATTRGFARFMNRIGSPNIVQPSGSS